MIDMYRIICFSTTQHRTRGVSNKEKMIGM